MLSRLCLAGSGAVAGDDPASRLNGYVAAEVQNDWAFASDDPANEQNELGASIETGIALQLSPSWSANAVLQFEAVQDPGPGEDRFFDDHGLFAERLTLDYEGEHLALHAGKFGPHFSIGYDEAAGLFGADLAEDNVELSEFVGAGAACELANAGYPGLTVSASVVTLDRTFLSQSVVTGRGRVRLSDGGVGNTRYPQSFTLALDAVEPFGQDNLRVHAGYALMSVRNAPAEHRFAAAATWQYDLGAGTSLTPLAEYVLFVNQGGNANATQQVGTLSLGLEHGDWNAALAYGGRVVAISGAGNGDTYDDQISASAGYAFDNGLSLDAGYKFNRTANVDNHTVGVVLAWGFEF